MLQSLILAIFLCVHSIIGSPNVIIFVSDDQGWADVSWRDANMVTPTLASLANSGVILENNYVHATCSPTRSALMTGYYPHRTGMQDGVLNPLDPYGLPLMFTLMPQKFKELGYDTYMAGKWHLGFCNNAYRPNYRGFDYFYGYLNGGEDYWSHLVSANRLGTQGYDFYENDVVDWSAQNFYSTDLFRDYVVNILNTRSKEKPFFIYFPFQSVHTPINSVPDQYASACSQSNSTRKLYCNTVYAMDQAIAAVVEALKTNGYYDDTIIAFTSDNGGSPNTGANNYPLKGQKDTQWEGGQRAPALVSAPNYIKTPGSRTQLFHVSDWYVTLLAAAGYTDPTFQGDGVDQWKMITENAISARSHVIYYCDSDEVVVRDARYKYVEGNAGTAIYDPNPNVYSRRKRALMYDLTYDPSETKPLTSKSTSNYATILASFLAQKAKCQAEIVPAVQTFKTNDTGKKGLVKDITNGYYYYRTWGCATINDTRTMNNGK